jgi:glutaredoxin
MIEVYSKPNCQYCTKAVALLNRLGMPFVEKKIGVDVTREQLLEVAPGARTVPQIVINGQVIGGYDDLAKYVESDNFNKTGFTL